VVQFLLDVGADVSATDFRGQTALCIACKNGHNGVVRALIQKGANVNRCDNDTKTPLYTAVEGGHEEEVVATLLGARAVLNAVDVMGRAPLHICAAHGYDAVLRELFPLAKGIVQKQSNSGESALFLAAEASMSFSGQIITRLALFSASEMPTTPGSNNHTVVRPANRDYFHWWMAADDLIKAIDQAQITRDWEKEALRNAQAQKRHCKEACRPIETMHASSGLRVSAEHWILD